MEKVLYRIKINEYVNSEKVNTERTNIYYGEPVLPDDYETTEFNNFYNENNMSKEYTLFNKKIVRSYYDFKVKSWTEKNFKRYLKIYSIEYCKNDLDLDFYKRNMCLKDLIAFCKDIEKDLINEI